MMTETRRANERKEKYICICIKRKREKREKRENERVSDRGGRREKRKRRVLFSDDREPSATFFAHNVITRYCIAFGERLSFYLTPVSLLNRPSASHPAPHRPRHHFLPPSPLPSQDPTYRLYKRRAFGASGDGEIGRNGRRRRRRK